ncbi:MAG: phosphoenolpyruvate synthase [Sphingobacteriales bacterium 50-39]|nr:phosphoenolpyruvate synthase [Sphingobacteriales bacterium]OJW56409.1 MAG: phosphoenolpyruvate synthase [Sphingobacteriales bacterium 50-39]
MKKYIKTFSEIGIKDVPEVGGKNASLGEMYCRLADRGIRVPDGFAVTAAAFDHFIHHNGLERSLSGLMQRLDKNNYSNLSTVGREARELLLSGEVSAELFGEIVRAYRDLCGNGNCLVAVRSSATAEDMPDASFAGQHESYLHISGEIAVIEAVRKCFASLYTDRAIKYRQDNGYGGKKVSLSVGVQKMVRSDKACAGIGFTLEPESGFRDIVHLSGVWGLGENIVQGAVTPDEFFIFKPSLLQGRHAIIRKKLGKKEKMLVYREGDGVANLPTPEILQDSYVLGEKEIFTLAGWALEIEKHYGRPMDIEWAKDGVTDELFIVQARPETVQSRRDINRITEYAVTTKGECLVKGDAVGEHIASGRARLLASPADGAQVEKGDIIVTDVTSPDWDPVLKKAGAIVTNRGGRTSHASIVARELGVPAIVGAAGATEKIKDGDIITVSCCEGRTGFVYNGKAGWKENIIDLSQVRLPEHTKAMLIVGDPEKAFELSFYPNSGVGLLRMEFIITSFIKAHPMALIKYNELKEGPVKTRIGELSQHYKDKSRWFIDELASGIATIAAAFYPKEVIVRTSDFKTNEYAHLLGGELFEPVEENPMLGFRGASRYYHDLYKEAFRLECAAIAKVRDAMGLTNLKVMIPFCRTVEEGRKVLALMEQYGLKQGSNGLEVYVMAEIPSNVLLAQDFAEIFDGFSIGSNDLTQLTLGIDRDSSIVAGLFNEQDKAARKMIGNMITAAHEAGAKVGLCGQAPSDFPDFTEFLVRLNIDSISFNPDALLKGIANINRAERPAPVHIL